MAADLTADAGWAVSTRGIDYVLHVVSPFPSTQPEDDDELILPARDGALRVLSAARDAGVKRVVMTSSFAAIGYGHTTEGPFDETVWTDTNAPIRAYIKSKTIAERAAWEFMDREGGLLELTVINPTGIFGPALGPDYSGSLGLINALLTRQMPFLPDVSFGVVDVRDAADLHLRAMTSPDAAGERFIASGGVASLADMAGSLRADLGAAASKVPTRRIPTWMLRPLATFVPSLRELSSDAGIRRMPALGKAARVLGWEARPIRQTVIDTARSLLALQEANAD